MTAGTMRGLVCSAYGSLDDLEIQEISRPELPSGSVRIRVTVAAVNPPDVLMPRGLYQVKPPLPFVPGIEGAGVVLETAPDVNMLKPGDRVMTYAGQGCFAEEVVVAADRVFPIPPDMSDEAASGFVLAYGTVHHALIDCGELAGGQTMAALGAAGGLGLAAIQIGKAIGARVVAVASTPDKRARCLQAGADDALDSDPEHLRDRLRAQSGSGGPDVILDVVGGKLTEPALRAIAPFGRLVIAGYASGTIPAIKANLILLKQAKVVGASYRLLTEQQPDRAARTMERLAHLWSAGLLAPHVSRRFPFTEIRIALDHVGAGKAVGKVVVDIAPG